VLEEVEKKEGMMEEKRPIGVIFFVLFGLVSLCLTEFPKFFPIDPAGVVIFILSIIVLYSLYQLKNWARIILLILEILGATLLGIYFIGLIIIAIFDPDAFLTHKLAYFSNIKWLHLIFGVIYTVAFIYYFTRPKVKEQFK
jgi:hypothetical protein